MQKKNTLYAGVVTPRTIFSSEENVCKAICAGMNAADGKSEVIIGVRGRRVVGTRAEASISSRAEMMGCKSTSIPVVQSSGKAKPLSLVRVDVPSASEISGYRGDVYVIDPPTNSARLIGTYLKKCAVAKLKAELPASRRVGTLFRNCGSCVVEVKRRQLGCVIRAIANVAELCKSSQSVNIGVNLRRGEMRLSTVGRSSHVYAAAQAVGIDIETEVAFSLRNADVIKVVVKPQGFKWDNRDFLVVSEHHIKRIVRAKKGCEKEIERLISKTMHDQEGTTPTESKPAAKVSFAMPDQEPAYKTPRKRQATMARPARSIARNPSYSALKRAIEAEAAKRGADVRAGDVATMMAYENSVGEAVYPSFDDVTGAGYYQTMEPTYISRPTVPLSEPFYELAN